MTKENAENVFYGDVKYAPVAVLSKKLADAKSQIAEVEREIARRLSFTPDQVLADRLHRLLHIGLDCDYAYSDWGGSLTACRADFLGLASRIIELGQPSYLDTILSQMERTRFGQNYREIL